MKIVASIANSSTPPTVNVIHNGQSLPFNISTYSRGPFQETLKGFDVFEQINQYWTTLSPQRQQDIFDTYLSIHADLYNNLISSDELLKRLKAKSAQLVDYHNIDDLQSWAMVYSNIVVPESVIVEYVESIDNTHSRDKTFTRSDYAKQLALALSFRIMLPIWGEYVFQIRRDKGTKFKEYSAFQLIGDSHIYQCEAMEKLRRYIVAVVADDKDNPNNILDGISSEDYCDWLLALICIRRLAIADIRGTDDRSNLAALLFNYIFQKLKNSNESFADVVKDKGLSKGSGEENENNKLSVWEAYKKSTNISPGEIVELEFSVKDARRIAFKLSGRINDDILNRSIETSSVLIDKYIADPQVTLLRWVMKPVISPQGLLYLKPETIVQLLGVCEAVLWARGFPYLAILITSYPAQEEDVAMYAMTDSKMRVTKELQDELQQVFPLTRTLNRRTTVDNEINLVAKSIDNLTNKFMGYQWVNTADERMLMELFGIVNRRMPIVPDIKNHLTKLAIELGKQSWF